MKKNIFLFIFLLPLFCLIIWTGYLTYQQKNGKEVKVRISGYDPRDLLSGHYISYQIDWNKTDCSQFENNICPKENFCRRKAITHPWRAPCRFYIPEKYAKQLDSALNNADREKNTFEVTYSYIKGREPIAQNLLINGKDWRESIK